MRAQWIIPYHEIPKCVLQINLVCLRVKEDSFIINITCCLVSLLPSDEGFRRMINSGPILNKNSFNLKLMKLILCILLAC